MRIREATSPDTQHELVPRRLLPGGLTPKEVVMLHYGPLCACCGTPNNPEIDHIDGNGKAHREEIGVRGGSRFTGG